MSNSIVQPNFKYEAELGHRFFPISDDEDICAFCGETVDSKKISKQEILPMSKCPHSDSEATDYYLLTYSEYL